METLNHEFTMCSWKKPLNIFDPQFSYVKWVAWVGTVMASRCFNQDSNFDRMVISAWRVVLKGIKAKLRLCDNVGNDQLTMPVKGMEWGSNITCSTLAIYELPERQTLS